MADSLAKYGIYIDDLSKIRVLEPEVANQTNKLNEECQNFVSSEFYGDRSDYTIICVQPIAASVAAASLGNWLREAGR